MGIKAENLIGKRFGKWLVIERDNNKYERPKWICECECGNIRSVYGHSLKAGGSTNCGCVRPIKKVKEKKPQTFCKAPNCDAISKSGGMYCSRHAEQLRKNGYFTNINPIRKINEYRVCADGCVEIFLYNRMGKVIATTIINEHNLELCVNYKWHITNGYASAIINGALTYLHRLLLNATNEETVDHINRNCLDNRIENLRICSQEQNLWNSKKPSHNTSGYKGVCFDKSRNKWVAQISIKNVTKLIGRFSTKEEAYAAYVKRASEIRGQYARFE